MSKVGSEVERYFKSLVRTPQLIYKNAFNVRSFDEHQQDESQSADMKRTLTPLDLVMLGIGAARCHLRVIGCACVWIYLGRNEIADHHSRSK